MKDTLRHLKAYMPSHLHYMITIACNQRCTKCSHWKYPRPTRRLPPSKIIETLHQIESLRHFCITGGEPLLHKDEICEIVKSMPAQVECVIITNGVGIDREFLSTMSRANVKIVFSIDTLDEAKWYFVRGCKSRDVVIANLKESLKFLGSERVLIQSTIAKETIEDVAIVAEFAYTHGISHITQYYTEYGFEGSWTPVTNAESTSSTGTPCAAAGRNLTILYNGDVTTCFSQTRIPGCSMPLGNLWHDDIKTILSSEYALFVLSRMMECDMPCKILNCNQ